MSTLSTCLFLSNYVSISQNTGNEYKLDLNEQQESKRWKTNKRPREPLMMLQLLLWAFLIWITTAWFMSKLTKFHFFSIIKLKPFANFLWPQSINYVLHLHFQSSPNQDTEAKNELDFNFVSGKLTLSSNGWFIFFKNVLWFFSQTKTKVMEKLWSFS